MFNPTLKQKIIHVYETRTRKLRASFKRKKLNRTDFTIISNNCWEGYCMKNLVFKNNPQQ